MKPNSTVFGIAIKSFLFSSLSILLAIPASFSCPCNELKPESRGPDISAKDGLAYMKTAEYKKEFSKAIADARKACEKHLGEEHLAIVSDIDETVISNKEYFEKHLETGWSDWDEWLHSEKGTLLKPTADWLAWARKKGFAIFFITGRSEIDRKYTIGNLVKQGLNYDGLYMRPNGDKSPAAEMKSKFRKQIEDMGFKIIVSIGDQWSDLEGGYAEDCEKLPNKLYFIK